MTKISILSLTVLLIGYALKSTALLAPAALVRKSRERKFKNTPQDDDLDDLPSSRRSSSSSPSSPPSSSSSSRNEETTVRENEIGRMALGILRTGMADVDSLQVGNVVVAKYEIPSLQIWKDFGYEITGLYAQGMNIETGQLERLPLSTLSDPLPNSRYTRYMQIFSAQYHSNPVIVTPEEIGLVTVKAELQEAMLLAIPGFFWVFVATSFSNYYTDRYGGNFFDAKKEKKRDGLKNNFLLKSFESFTL